MQDDRAFFFNGTSSTPLWKYRTNNMINSVAISANGDFSVTGGLDERVYLFKLTDSENSLPPEKPSLIPIILTISGIVSTFFKKEWRFLMPDEHLHIPSLKGIKILLKEFNFEIIGQTRFGSGYTSGSIPNIFKMFFDKFGKIFSYGDRATFLTILKK